MKRISEEQNIRGNSESVSVLKPDLPFKSTHNINISWIKLLLFTVGSMVSLLLIELTLQLSWGDIKDSMWLDKHSSHEHLYVEAISGRPMFVKKIIDGEEWFLHNRHNRKGLKAFRAKKSEKEIRVFIAGESAAEVFGYGHKLFKDDLSRINSEKLYIDDILSRRFPNHRVNIVRCGLGGYTTAQLLPVIKDISMHQPDFVIFISGNRVIPESSPLYRIMANPPPSGILYFKSWVYKYIVDLLYSRESDTLFNIPQWADYYEEIVKVFNNSNIPAVLFTVPVNYRDRPPVNFYNRQYLYYFRTLLAREKYDEILEIARNNSKSTDSGFWYIAGQACLKLGDIDSARKYLKLSRDCDTNKSRSDSRRNDFIRDVARRYDQQIFDAEKILDDLLENELPGLNYFWDECHWHSFISNIFMDDLVRKLNKRTFDGVKPVSEENLLPEYSENEIRQLTNIAYDKMFSKKRLLLYIYNSIIGIRENAVPQMVLIIKKNPEVLIKMVEEDMEHVLEIQHSWFRDDKQITKNWFMIALNAAEAAIIAGETDLAERFLKDAEELNPDSEKYNFIKFQLEIEIGKYEEAYDSLLKAVNEEEAEELFHNVMNVLNDERINAEN